MANTIEYFTKTDKTIPFAITEQETGLPISIVNKDLMFTVRKKEGLDALYQASSDADAILSIRVASTDHTDAANGESEFSIPRTSNLQPGVYIYDISYYDTVAEVKGTYGVGDFVVKSNVTKSVESS